MSKLIFIFIISLQFLKSEAQETPVLEMDVNLTGYLFKTTDGLFFQPFDFEQRPHFLESLNKSSFKIEETPHGAYYRDVMEGVGHQFIVKRFTEDTIRKNPNLRVYDTINYFRCKVDIAMNFFEKDYTEIASIGYGFFVNDSLLYYGNLFISNHLMRIEPTETNVLKQLHSSYVKKRMGAPLWLETLYKERVIRIKSRSTTANSSFKK